MQAFGRPSRECLPPGTCDRARPSSLPRPSARERRPRSRSDATSRSGIGAEGGLGRGADGAAAEVTLDPREIFELIVKADERLKYARSDKANLRRRQARELLERARDEAWAIGNDALVAQAERRLADLAAMGEEPGEPPPIAGGSPTGSTRRPTPADAHPEPRPPERSADAGSYPPELGTDAIAILEGRTFMFSNAFGDVPTGSIGGLLHDDTRFLSCWELRLNGRPLSLLKSQTVDHYSAAFFLTNPELPNLRAYSLSIRRFRFVG